jgi:DNA end-binding protein Ku
MEQLHYADELRPTTEVPIPDGDVSDKELKLAMMLIEQTSNEEFEPTKYKDTVRERVMEMIQKNLEGQEITSAEPVAQGGDKIIDLMAALKASLAKTSKASDDSSEIPIVLPETPAQKQMVS